MGADSKIQWTDHTFNPWRGCQKVAAGCANCYAETLSKRNPGTLGIWGPNGTRVLASEAMWREPLKWSKAARDWQFAYENLDEIARRGHDEPTRPRVFCASLADVFEAWCGDVRNSRGELLINCPKCGLETFRANEPPLPSGCEDRPLTLDDARARLFRLIDVTPNLDWLLLTKRPENVRRMWPSECSTPTSVKPIVSRHNVWLGTSIANQQDADRNIPELLKCRDLAAKLFVSVEPLVGPVDLAVPWEGETTLPTIQMDWVIVGGESGPNARPCNVEWIRSIVRQCQAAGVPVFVKQLGATVYDNSGESRCMWPGLTRFQHHNGDADDECEVLLRDPKGGDPSEWPEDLRVREFPT